MSAAAIARTLKGQRTGSGWLIRCPCHDDRSPSCSISDGAAGRLLVHCFAGCDPTDILASLGGFQDNQVPDAAPARPPRPAADNSGRAVALWDEHRLAVGSRVEAYLRSRKLVLFPGLDLGFHPRCPRGPYEAREYLPAMLAPMRHIHDNRLTAVHRTFLTADGSSKAPGQAKMMLGDARDAAIKLNPDDQVTTGLGVCEGIETGLALIGRGWHPIWALASAGGIARFPVLDGIECLTIFADQDEPGLAAARTCADRWAFAGKEVRICTPHAGDWLDASQAAAGVR